ncbi:MAG: hypothetical protein SWH61_16495 [Thermodesulfobacteriota bacterium]|nr:hypothetical protein [Thermodesulfobacteriota bacterium]
MHGLNKISHSIWITFVAIWLMGPMAAHAELNTVQLEMPNASVDSSAVDKRTVKGVGEAMPAWVVEFGRLYLKEAEGEDVVEALLQLLAMNLGIQKDGNLDMVALWDGAYDLAGCSDSTENISPGAVDWLYYLKDKFSLTGFNYLFFEICLRHRDRYEMRFIRYFENGFYPHRAVFTKTPHYYQILYYYLTLVADDLSQRFNSAADFLSQYPDKTPWSVRDVDLARFRFAVSVAADLDTFVSKDTGDETALWERVFAPAEQRWIKNTITYFLGVPTHDALLSYEWFRKNLPLHASADAFAHDIIQTWERQATVYRTRLPLMFFAEKGETRISIENLFNATLDKLRLDNRAIDIMIMSALETWLTKQVRHGIRIDDRLNYNYILAELKVCPTGWIFANLYDCRADIAALKAYAGNWRQMADKEEVFQADVMDRFFSAKGKIDRIFGDLEKIFGKEPKAGSVNYIFHKYRGEVYYYFKYIQFETFGDDKTVIPAAGPEANYLKDFEAAFIQAPESPQNHINLLNGYNLLFRKLLAGGRTSEIRERERSLATFVNGSIPLGSRLSHAENNLYDIYRVLTDAYLSSENFEPRALETARKGFELARDYYMKAADVAGYTDHGSVGAIIKENTEMDDYQRQFELYKKVANRLGKKIQLLVTEEDVQLYNRIQGMRSLGNLSQ